MFEMDPVPAVDVVVDDNHQNPEEEAPAALAADPESNNLNEVLESFSGLQVSNAECAPKQATTPLDVYNAARDGSAADLSALLSNKPDDVRAELVNHLFNEDGQVCSPIIIASRNGHSQTVQTLLDEFGPDLEAEGTVKFDGHVIEGATALWCAAGETIGAKKCLKVRQKLGTKNSNV